MSISPDASESNAKAISCLVERISRLLTAKGSDLERGDERSCVVAGRRVVRAGKAAWRNVFIPFGLQVFTSVRWYGGTVD